MDRRIIDRIDAYCDAVPRGDAQVLEVGPIEVFLRGAAWPYYARPARRDRGAISADDIRRGLAELAVRDLEPAAEWVHEASPDMTTAARALLAIELDQLRLVEHPLLVAELSAAGPTNRRAEPGSSPGRSATPVGFEVDFLVAGDPRVEQARAVQDVGFANPGTAVAVAGPAQRDAAVRPPSASLHRRLGDGRSVMAVLTVPDSGVVAAGMHQPVGDTCEIVGVATLPAVRRQGAAAMLTSALLADASQRGLSLAFLTADDEAVARIYQRVGLRRVGTSFTLARVTPSHD